MRHLEKKLTSLASSWFDDILKFNTIHKKVMRSTVQITTTGIKKHLRSFTPESAITEYIWNGFDAGASKIILDFHDNGLGIGGYESLEIRDNGQGIRSSDLSYKFHPYYESEKKHEKNISLPRGHNGYGRFTFITFASNAKWETVYKEGREKDSIAYEYTITIDRDKAEDYQDSIPKKVVKKTGTRVLFTNLDEIDEGFLKSKLIPHIKREFGWFLALYPNKTIKINEVNLTINEIINDQSLVIEYEEFDVSYKKTHTNFKVKYIQWSEQINNEYSRIYYLTEEGKERFNEFTSLNKKGDSFYHSLYVKSDFFGQFQFIKTDKEPSLLKEVYNRSSKEFTYIENELKKYLRKKRKPFLKDLSIKVVGDYEKSGVLRTPTESSSQFEIVQYQSLKETLAELYQIEPRIFLNFNEEQKKTFVGLISVVMQSGRAKDDLLKILESVIKMDEEERQQLSGFLNKVSMNGLLKLGKLIEERYDVYHVFKEVIYEREETSYEKEIQKLVEENLWMIDEAYHLVTAEEDDFEEALRKLLELKGKPQPKKSRINDKDKNKEMDIFAIRQKHDGDGIQHLVIELKRAKTILSKKHFDQINSYKDVILKEARFNSENAMWKFYLIGSKLDDFIKNQKQQLKTLGDRDLIYLDVESDFRCYALTWSQVFDRFTIKHDHLKDALMLQSEKVKVTTSVKERVEIKFGKRIAINK